MNQKITSDQSVQESFNNTRKIEPTRDESQIINTSEGPKGKITGYEYTIYGRRNIAPLKGNLSREQVEAIYNLYSKEGANLTRRALSREPILNDIIYEDLVKILTTLKAQKDSAPLAPHIIEEKSIDELVDITFQNKENNYLRKLDQDRGKQIESKYKASVKKYYDLKNQLVDLSDILSDIEFKITPVNYIVPEYKNDNTIIVYLSDMHIGAEVSNYSIYENTFNFDVATSRMEALLQKIYQVCNDMNITQIIVCNVGDSLDGYNGQTTRGGHILPQNMNNKDQYNNYINLMMNFFANLVECKMFSYIKYRCSDGGNHDGDIGLIINKSLKACLYRLCPDIDAVIFDKFMGYFTVNSNSFILCHGKDAKDMFRGLPLTINDKVENQITEFVQYNNIPGIIHFVKGDLHQSATTYGKRVRYKSVGSFFGSSQWIHLNFGNTRAAVDYDVIINDTDIFEGRLLLN